MSGYVTRAMAELLSRQGVGPADWAAVDAQDRKELGDMTAALDPLVAEEVAELEAERDRLREELRDPRRAEAKRRGKAVGDAVAGQAETIAGLKRQLAAAKRAAKENAERGLGYRRERDEHSDWRDAVQHALGYGDMDVGYEIAVVLIEHMHADLDAAAGDRASVGQLLKEMESEATPAEAPNNQPNKETKA